jgi:hypothetical protein
MDEEEERVAADDGAGDPDSAMKRELARKRKLLRLL